MGSLPWCVLGIAMGWCLASWVQGWRYAGKINFLVIDAATTADHLAGARKEIAALRECICASGSCSARKWHDEIPSTAAPSAEDGATNA